MNYDAIRLDHRIILEMVPRGSSVLDLGCGTGELLFLLVKEKGARAQGIEIDEQAIYKCVARGLNVIHGDIDTGLSEYRDKSFDYVILNQSLQQVEHLEPVLMDSLRVGRKVIVGFPTSPTSARASSCSSAAGRRSPRLYRTPGMRLPTGIS